MPIPPTPTRATTREDAFLDKNDILTAFREKSLFSLTDSEMVYRIEYDRTDGTIRKGKARLCVRGFTQVYGADFDDTLWGEARRMEGCPFRPRAIAHGSLAAHAAALTGGGTNAQGGADGAAPPTTAGGAFARRNSGACRRPRPRLRRLR